MEYYIDSRLQQQIEAILAEQQGERIFSFVWQQQRYWLKQTEHNHGWMRLLKARPQRALQREIKQLQQLNQQQAAVPSLVAYGKGYFVVKDVGRTLNLWLEDPAISLEQKTTILADSAKALAQLHQQHIVHGRPALRDIAWHNGEVKFIDFEAAAESFQARLNYGKLRDLLVFIHSLYRFKSLSQSQIAHCIQHYQTAVNPATWQYFENFARGFAWLYYLVRPFKAIAGSDLLALIGLFDYLRKCKDKSVSGEGNPPLP